MKTNEQPVTPPKIIRKGPPYKDFFVTKPIDFSKKENDLAATTPINSGRRGMLSGIQSFNRSLLRKTPEAPIQRSRSMLDNLRDRFNKEDDEKNQGSNTGKNKLNNEAESALEEAIKNTKVVDNWKDEDEWDDSPL